MLKIVNVVGARPNFMKMAPIVDAMKVYPREIQQTLVHTGQHYDEKMSKSFFVDLGIPEPDLNLEVGAGSHAQQTAGVMVAFEKVCLDIKPDLVIVVGDVNSTMACTITAKKLGVKVAHVEAGLRSRDMAMPEEINRLCTDVISDYLFTTDERANANLKSEGVDENKIHFVGNVMIDTLLKHKEKAAALPFAHWGLNKGDYATVTLHRPSNVDDKQTLQGILEALHEIAQHIKVVFPMHPRTRKMVNQFNLSHLLTDDLSKPDIYTVEPLGYLEFLRLNMDAKMVLTDSGGLQEETTVLGIPCITLRHNTERPITCDVGTNVIVGNDKRKILAAAKSVLDGTAKRGGVPDRWDGKAAERIVEILIGLEKKIKTPL
ncbi:MAG: UDP-N-acetylglucosamine 2-epimerase (non-hydrolyzing) [Gammaproteobacteria bacterium]